MVLADEHDHLAAEIFHRAQPLVRVEFRRIEKRRLFTPAAPLDFIERVHAEVEEERPLQPHPSRLIGARQNLRRLFGDDGGGIAFGNHLHRGIRNRSRVLVRGRLTVGERKIQEEDASQRNVPGRAV